MSFTPGPWTVEQDEEFDWRYTIRGPYPEIPNATYALLKTLGNGNNNEGNARLAAAAPEMAALLKAAYHELTCVTYVLPRGNTHDHAESLRLKIAALMCRVFKGEESAE